MATVTDYNRLRRDVSANSTVLPDADAELLFVEAAETYTSARTINADARILFLQGLTASASKMNDYVQNNSSESASQIYKQVRDLLAYWTVTLNTAIEQENAASAAAQSVRVKVLPSW